MGEISDSGGSFSVRYPKSGFRSRNVIGKGQINRIELKEEVSSPRIAASQGSLLMTVAQRGCVCVPCHLPPL